MYRKYRKEIEKEGLVSALGESAFRKIFTDDNNISFHCPKKISA